MNIEFIITTSISLVSLAVSIFSLKRSKSNKNRLTKIETDIKKINFQNVSAFSNCTNVTDCKGNVHFTN